MVFLYTVFITTKIFSVFALESLTSIMFSLLQLIFPVVSFDVLSLMVTIPTVLILLLSSGMLLLSDFLFGYGFKHHYHFHNQLS